MSARKQYQECYRLERLVQQSVAMFDAKSLTDLQLEYREYPAIFQLAASYTWVEKLGARKNGRVNIRVMMAWHSQYRESQAVHQ